MGRSAARIVLPPVVVLDLDDTLYPEYGFVRSGFRAVAEAFADVLGEPGAAAERMWQLQRGDHAGHVFDIMLEDLGVEPSEPVVRRMIDTYRRHRPMIRLFDDAAAFLDAAAGRRRLALLSDGPAVMQRGKVDALGIAGRFEVVVFTDEHGPGFAKPGPRGFEWIAERLDVRHDDCAYVADNPVKDFVAPNALGWLTVRVRRPDGVYADRSAPAGGQPRHVVDSLRPLTEGLLG